ncbi:uncharacterized protein LOC143536657 [Bidens hawaiensis]|uniref:uncharacterized protein LOC143536657 n=1 Tax=Bidens hawaiensis TaxID=980011 RepID=UPI00404A8635
MCGGARKASTNDSKRKMLEKPKNTTSGLDAFCFVDLNEDVTNESSLEPEHPLWEGQGKTSNNVFFARREIKELDEVFAKIEIFGAKFEETTVFTDHSALRFLFQKKDAKPRIVWWILLLSEFDIEIKDKKGEENVVADHLSRLEDPKREEIREDAIGDEFPLESNDFVDTEKQCMPWFTDFANYLANGVVLKGMTKQQKKKFFLNVHSYVWDDPFFVKIGGDRILRRCVTREEGLDILRHVHEGLTGAHHGAHATTQKIFDYGFYWPTVVKDALKFVKMCDAYQ